MFSLTGCLKRCLRLRARDLNVHDPEQFKDLNQ
jgi:hypothetical protein